VGHAAVWWSLFRCGLPEHAARGCTLSRIAGECTCCCWIL